MSRTPSNKPLHTEPRAARLGEIKVVRRGPVNGDVIRYELEESWNKPPLPKQFPSGVALRR